MDASSIVTVGQYTAALSRLLSSPRDDAYSDRLNELAAFAARTVFRASQAQLTASGHTEYRLNFEELASGVDQGNFLPVILERPGNYDLGPKVHVHRSNHLNDRIAA